MNEIVMVTGNGGKYKVANDIFIKKGLNLIQEKIETPEILKLVENKADRTISM